MHSLQSLWFETTWIAIDLETTGKYPLDAEICEMAAVKWRGGQVLETFQSLIKPTMRMSDEVIAIHKITNEMVEGAPTLAEKLGEFHRFIGDGFVLAHHAPFDMGFLAWEFEKACLVLPSAPAFCTSLLSRHLNANVSNHRLATLAEHFGIDAGAAHRALDDAKTCLGVGLKYFEKLGREAKVSDILGIQTTHLPWSRFSIETLMGMTSSCCSGPSSSGTISRAKSGNESTAITENKKSRRILFIAPVLWLRRQTDVEPPRPDPLCR